MLCQLTVENIALIQRLTVDLSPGLTIITGETGAGKSIVIDALGLVLGERAESGLIRDGAERATVHARFEPPPDHPANRWLREQSLENPDGSELYLRRVLREGGRSQAFINETPVPLATLRTLGELLVDIHGQHDHQSLLHGSAHRPILDEFAGHAPLVAAVAAAHEQWHQAHRALHELRARAAAGAERRAFLAFQVEELETAAVRPGEQGELEARRARLAHAGRLAEGSARALALLTEESAAGELLSRAAGELEEAVALDPELSALAEAARSLHYELEDVAERLRHYADGLEIDPAALAELEERLDLIHTLSRKHRQDPDQLEALLANYREELAALDHREEREERLEQELARLREVYRNEAEALGESRRQAAQRLVREVEAELKGLHMAGTRVAVNCTPLAGDPRPQGMEEVAFLVSANPGEPLKPLRQVASGGELSRLMLALKTVLADAVTVATLIFDEVDVGVGGRVAAAIGARLARVSGNRQVLAITHLPQVAAWGGRHLKVVKESGPNRTRVTVTPLDPDARVEELARMLAGEEITDSARENARELLRKARQEPSPVPAKGRRGRSGTQ